MNGKKALALLATVPAAVLGVAAVTYGIAFFSPYPKQNNPHLLPPGEQYEQEKERMHRLIGELETRPFEWVTITSRDGLRLNGRYYHQADGAPVAIGFHGYRGTAIRDFSGGANISFDYGLNVLLVDQRAHGESGGHTIGFGIKERYDCLDWINYVKARFGADVPIVLYGVSMGAATVLMASGMELPENVRGIVADSPYDSPAAIIQKVSRDLHVSPKLAYPFLNLGARAFGRLHLRDGDTVEAVRHSRVPILIIHGADDRFVPCDMSRTIAEANPENVRRHTFDGAGHGLSYIADADRYKSLICEFLDEIL